MAAVAIKQLGLAITLIGGLGFLFTTAGLANGWPQFGGPDGNFRLSPEDTAEEPESNTAVTPWSMQLDAGDAAPVVAGRRVIVAEAAFTEEGLDAHQINCLDLRTGQILWQKVFPEESYVSQDISDRYPVRPLASCAIVRDRVFALGFGGSLSCLQLETGKLLWRKDLVTDFGATPLQYGFASSPWCDDHQLIIACGGPEALILALSQHDGKQLWALGAGELGYGGFCAILKAANTDQEKSPRSSQLAYMARDEVLAFDTRSGVKLWSVDLPERGLTNAVTPLSLPGERLLIGGQGSNGCILFDYRDADAKTSPKLIWSNHKAQPFYCNWLCNPRATQVLGSSGAILGVLALDKGAIAWNKRGWTDANFIGTGDQLVAVRGDGVAATARWTDEGLKVERVQRVITDRVWAPPVMVGSRLLVRGRNSLSCINWRTLSAATSLPKGTKIDAMTAMYGARHEAVEKLSELAQNSPQRFNWSDFERVALDRSVFLGEEEFTSLIDTLEKGGNRPLAEKIAAAWTQREPYSVPAYERLLRCQEHSNNQSASERLRTEREVRVTFLVEPPKDTPPTAAIYITGNAHGLGNWQPKGVLMRRRQDGVYRGSVLVPKGDLQFKCTQGSWELEEKRADGRSISNRRRRIVGPCEIRFSIAAWG